ncbi:helix-turn-helix domain-containing protein [Peribacillus huizhouensis]|uniref:AraC-like DNA-binding protein n=1 Tax=Peribacillus huizhouensis TaxID=1501239 RepID=A0ABR6CST5_9BACI|nr:AraC family transcriptional regulator [Peribacillus huizhouensis]MBA9027417.1 AraC-like DNA-binding protein [Peribacillus huizhouensis]
MQPIQKLFNPDNFFPFQIVYKDTKSVEVELPYHFHDWYEIVYVYDGNGTFFIDHSILSMEKGSIFIIPGNTLHRAIPDYENPVTSTAIFFNPILIQNRILGDSFSYFHIFEESLRLNNFKYKLDGIDEQIVFANFLETIQLEVCQETLGYRHATLLELQALLLYLGRIMTSCRSTAKAAEFSGPIWMKDILGYIEENYTLGISLDQLSQFGNVSTAHLSRVFKQMTGFNVSDYITTKKIIKAKELLLSTDEKINTIALECGFESLPHFHRTFKKLIGSTPSTFRKKKIEEM